MKRISPDNSFSLPRFIHLCKRNFVVNSRQWVMGLMVTSGLILIIWLVPTLITDREIKPHHFEVLVPTAIAIFSFWGLWLTSDIFQDLHSPATAYQSLTLPATSTEKFLSAWVLTMPLFLTITISTLVLLGILTSLIVLMMNGTDAGFQFYNPFNSHIGDFTTSYLYYNSLFLLGAIYFRKNNFLKTLLVLIIIVVSVVIIIAIISTIFAFGSGFSEISLQLDNTEQLKLLLSTAKIVIMATALLLTYVLLKRRQLV